MRPLSPNALVRVSLMEDHRPGINCYNITDVEGLRLENTWAHTYNQAALVKGVKSAAARASAEKLGLSVSEFESFNFLDQLDSTVNTRGIEIRNIVVPAEYRGLGWIDHVRVMNHRLDYSEVTRVLNHMAMWHHCTVVGAPLIILEHDAVLDSTPVTHLPRNSVIGLDTKGTLTQVNTNYRVMPGVWAYAVDQFSSKRLFNQILSQGIREPLELMFRADQRLIVLKDHAHRTV